MQSEAETINTGHIRALLDALPTLKAIISDGPDLTDDNWTTAHIAKYSHCSQRHATDRICQAPGFPKGIRITLKDGSKTQRIWKRNVIMSWIDRQVER